MSRETLEWLNTMTLIGHTDRRGEAWHYREALQSGAPNHYGGAIPVDDVHDRLFTWHGVSRRVAVEVPVTEFVDADHYDVEGQPSRWAVIEGRVALGRSDRDTGDIFGVVSTQYTLHQYSDWLVTSVASLLGDDLSISSAGLLKRGAVAWVEVSVPENRSTAEGVEFRPNLLATTTMDGSGATIYKRTITDVVCDNTRAAALKENGEQLTVRHSKHSELKLENAHDAVQLVQSAADDFSAQVAALCKIRVTDKQWGMFLDRMVPLRSKTARPSSDYYQRLKEQKREELAFIYHHDPRCAPWKGTAHGVVQAVNTWEHHSAMPKKKELHQPDLAMAWRINRNIQRTVDDETAKLDRATYKTLSEVLGLAA